VLIPALPARAGSDDEGIQACGVEGVIGDPGVVVEELASGLIGDGDLHQLPYSGLTSARRGTRMA